MALSEKKINKDKDPGICKTTVRERRKKFVHIKDGLHKTFGNKNYYGFGNGSSRTCSLCGKKIIRGRYRDGEWTCEDCY